MTSYTDTQIGKWFESEVMTILKRHAETNAIYYHRLLDSHAAGRLVQPQLTDLILITPKDGTSYIELKASMKYRTGLEGGKKMFRPAQIGKAKMLIRAGQTPYCLFYDGEDDYVELWEIEKLIEPKKFTNPDWIFRVKSYNLESFLFEYFI